MRRKRGERTFTRGGAVELVESAHDVTIAHTKLQSGDIYIYVCIYIYIFTKLQSGAYMAPVATKPTMNGQVSLRIASAIARWQGRSDREKETNTRAQIVIREE